jgi:hypothetical protein
MQRFTNESKISFEKVVPQMKRNLIASEKVRVIEYVRIILPDGFCYRGNGNFISFGGE